MRKTIFTWLPYLYIILISIPYYLGIQTVPFHPDESTQILMSSDVKQLINNPSQFFWEASKTKSDLRQKYRELDAPVNRYLIEIGRTISNHQSIPVDWDWSLSWEENQTNGALPTPDLLLISRLSIAFLYPFSLILLFQIVKSMQNNLSAWIALILFSINPQILLHTRRAMAESAVLFFSLLSLWVMIKDENSNFLSGFPASLAFCAKQTSIPLFLSGIFNIFNHKISSAGVFQKLKKLLFYVFIYISMIYILNPFAWVNPLQAFQASWVSRTNFAFDQAKTFGLDTNQSYFYSIPLQVGKIAWGTFFERPRIEDTGNYSVQSIASTNFYFSNPFNNLLRDPISATILFILAITGFILSSIQLIKRIQPKQQILFLLWTSTLFQMALFIFIPVLFQRYFVLLIPYTCIWIGYSIDYLLKIKNDE